MVGNDLWGRPEKPGQAGRLKKDTKRFDFPLQEDLYRSFDLGAKDGYVGGAIDASIGIESVEVILKLKFEGLFHPRGNRFNNICVLTGFALRIGAY